MSKKVLNILKISETREVFGLTYRDLMDMDTDAFNYVSEMVTQMAKERLEQQKKAELRKEHESK